MRVFLPFVASCSITNAVAYTVAEAQDPMSSGFNELAAAPFIGAVWGAAGATVTPLGAWWVYLAYRDKIIEETKHTRSQVSPFRFPTRSGWTGGWKGI